VVLKRSTIWLSGQKYANIIEEWGLWIKDLRKMNVSLLCKWWWRLDNEEGLWQNIIRFKYIKVDLFVLLITGKMTLQFGLIY
jgi:hypothetical protein